MAARGKTFGKCTRNGMLWACCFQSCVLNGTTLCELGVPQKHARTKKHGTVSFKPTRVTSRKDARAVCSRFNSDNQKIGTPLPLAATVLLKLQENVYFSLSSAQLLGVGTHEQAGVYTFGGVDSTHCGPVIDYRPLIPTVQVNDAKEYTFWKFEVDSIAFRNPRVPQKRFAV